MSRYSGSFTYRGYLIAMFALFMSVQGLALVGQGTVDKVKAKAAAARIFAVMDRQSLIDPLSTDGKVLY
ncbi:hypothetical protein MPSEU_000569600 [Mayamaea pseudoterrestris]|nr:hypothetical protein MPSEU_000569600 [Mayamaea pseudoterrestris]